MFTRVNVKVTRITVNKMLKYVSASDILGPIDYFSDIDILVSFERDMFADYIFFLNEDIPFFHVYITTLKYMP